MSRRGLWAACVVLLVGVGVLAVGAGFAKDEDDKAEDDGAKCSDATLHGRYLYAYDAVEFLKEKGEERGKKVPIAVAGHQVFNGNGEQHGVSSGNVNGEIFSKHPFSGKYEVKADCTGTTTTDGTESDLFIAPDGSMFTWVYADPGVVASGSELRGTAKRVGD
jgi:hypothetical protein